MDAQTSTEKINSKVGGENNGDGVPFRHYAQAQATAEFDIPLIVNGNAFLRDIVTRHVYDLPKVLVYVPTTSTGF